LISLLVLSNSGLEVMEILRDPAQQSGQSSFLGFLSNIGIWLWVSAAAICFFALSNESSDLSTRELLFLLGLFSLILAVDDFFLIHDRYINQKICYLAYAAIAGAILVRHFKKIITINGFAFVLAGVLLALSIVTDLIQFQIPMRYFVVQIFEEGFKFVGAAAWLYFIIQTASKHMAAGRSVQKLPSS